MEAEAERKGSLPCFDWLTLIGRECKEIVDIPIVGQMFCRGQYGFLCGKTCGC